METDRKTKDAILLRLMLAVCETVAECQMTTGTPSGYLYAALSSQMSLDSYNNLMSGVERAGLLEKAWTHCYRITPKGLEFIAKARGRA